MHKHVFVLEGCCIQERTNLTSVFKLEYFFKRKIKDKEIKMISICSLKKGVLLGRIEKYIFYEILNLNIPADYSSGKDF